MPELTWETPPPVARSSVDYGGIAATLRERPGQWAKIDDGLEYLDMNRMYHSFRAVGVQTSRRVQPDGTYRMYARWPEP